VSTGPQGERTELLTEIVRTAYEDPRVVSRYVDVGLWPAEEILAVEYIPDGARVLDLGCGAGRTSVALAEIGLDVVGVDLSEPMVATAREQARLAGVEARFQVMNAMDLRFPDASFDVALFSYNGIELVPGLQGKRRVLDEVFRVLRPGGRFIFCAHSLFALNVFAPMRLKAFARLCAGRLLGVPVRERELGERFIDAEWEEARYLQIWPPSRHKRLLAEAGFALVCFNTRGRLERGRAWSWTGTFEDGERFFVAEKPAAPATARETGETSSPADRREQGGMSSQS